MTELYLQGIQTSMYLFYFTCFATFHFSLDMKAIIVFTDLTDICNNESKVS